MRIARSISMMVLALVASTALSAPPPANAPSAEEMGKHLRAAILPLLPSPLVEQEYNWGHQENVVVGVKWEKQGILLKPELLKKMHNDGKWRKIQAEADKPEANLTVSMQNLQAPEKGKFTFTTSIGLQTNIKFEQQIWRKGVRLYSGETRARVRVLLKLDCESTARVDRQPGSLLPDYVFRLRVTQADIGYDNFVCEHTAGLGGEAARILGDALHDTINQWKPSLERKLLDKANARIVKVADTKEIRISLSKLWDGGEKK